MPLSKILALSGCAILGALAAVLALIPAHSCCGRYLDLPASTRGLHLREYHHGWLVVLALIPWPPVQIAGLVLGVDDLFGQHLWHFSAKHARHRSPLHHLARVTWYRWRE